MNRVVIDLNFTPFAEQPQARWARLAITSRRLASGNTTGFFW